MKLAKFTNMIGKTITEVCYGDDWCDDRLHLKFSDGSEIIIASKNTSDPDGGSCMIISD